ncbi:hypothetical protein [Sediminispirochaeta bajacaliforniensis]|uniref:hypothetical protein n=1 Tax=Sediminispirochaeta bajacaliforniensis TaxID=148 RepID=UPI00037E5CD9|nr:hypothetical protein [Sediminispirochaeta bajacaliforniensis]
MSRKTFLSLSLFLVILAPLVAATEEENTDKGNSFSFSGNTTTITLQEGERKTVLSGDARITFDETSIKADEITLSGPDFRYIECTGAVLMEDTEKGITLKTKKLLHDRTLRQTRGSGYTEIVDAENELSARCYYFEQEEETETMVLQVGVRIDTVSAGKAVVCQSELARYNRGEKSLELIGSPSVEWKGDEYQADRILINMGNDTIVMEGSVSGSLTEEEEKAE